ncbi:MAG: phenylalanine 4-monooxygenase [Acidobacteriota bacterium]|nr:phenylalanine 4-monooxygenase [Acidobacteriota bacterium]MDQ7088325.1 phenylalanine 4-monooxygenase [Acidobacteriota bacterium]
MRTGIIELEADHPGFNDPEYRRRRDEIARRALEHQPGQAPPHIEYTESENRTWKQVYEGLTRLYPTHACREYNEAFGDIGFSPDRIPQLAEIDDYLKSKTGFRIQPVAGLVESRDFLASLAQRIFPSTAYIRHHSTPHYTPEPDVCHELLGHVPMLAIPEYADLMQKIGEGSVGGSDEQILQFGRLYWYTIEFGVVRQAGQLKAYGAGLLSSPGELAHAVEEKPEIRRFDPDEARQIENPITTYQPILYEVCSIREAFYLVAAFIERIKHGL